MFPDKHENITFGLAGLASMVRHDISSPNSSIQALPVMQTIDPDGNTWYHGAITCNNRARLIDGGKIPSLVKLGDLGSSQFLCSCPSPYLEEFEEWSRSRVNEVWSLIAYDAAISGDQSTTITNLRLLSAFLQSLTDRSLVDAPLHEKVSSIVQAAITNSKAPSSILPSNVIQAIRGGLWSAANRSYHESDIEGTDVARLFNRLRREFRHLPTSIFEGRILGYDSIPGDLFDQFDEEYLEDSDIMELTDALIHAYRALPEQLVVASTEYISALPWTPRSPFGYTGPSRLDTLREQSLVTMLNAASWIGVTRLTGPANVSSYRRALRINPSSANPTLVLMKVPALEALLIQSENMGCFALGEPKESDTHTIFNKALELAMSDVELPRGMSWLQPARRLGVST